jgi:hypothetical protein
MDAGVSGPAVRVEQDAGMNGTQNVLTRRRPVQKPPARTQEGTAMSTTVAEPLTVADRCDRCGAQAYLRVTLPSGGELLFCAHHARAHQDKLRQVALNIHDETSRLA